MHATVLAEGGREILVCVTGNRNEERFLGLIESEVAERSDVAAEPSISLGAGRPSEEADRGYTLLPQIRERGKYGCV